MKKNDNIKIVQISSSANHAGFSIFGLGEDQLIYNWNWKEGCWLMNKENVAPGN